MNCSVLRLCYLSLSVLIQVELGLIEGCTRTDHYIIICISQYDTVLYVLGYPVLSTYTKSFELLYAPLSGIGIGLYVSR